MECRVDHFHYTGHVGCSEGYDPRVYQHPWTCASAESSPHVNSEVAEQANSSLAAIKNAAAYMKQNHFLLYLRRYLGFYNARKIERLA
jgi:hypothetical protein